MECSKHEGGVALLVTLVPVQGAFAGQHLNCPLSKVGEWILQETMWDDDFIIIM